MVAELSSPSSSGAELLSRITGQKIRQEALTSRVFFFTALATILAGVMFVDGQATEEEKQRIQKIFNQFFPSSSDANQLIKLMLIGIQKHQIYRNPSDLLTLTTSLSTPEKLLLIGFGYEIAISDGEIDPKEKRYLQIVAKWFQIESQYLAVLEAGISKKEITDLVALDDIQNLLDPSRFQTIDPILSNAASYIRSHFIAQLKPEKSSSKKSSLSYQQLEKLKDDRHQIDLICHQFAQIIQDYRSQYILPSKIEEEVAQISKKIQSQRFRIAVIGEFSQGKSTLLNALLGEEIQPTRAIPCSGAITILRYGEQKRVICRYKDGREEEIPFDQYQDKAAISEQAALCGLSDELARSEIEEIILEHPSLELCRHSVEIIDSPGLNEHPDRTAVTQKLLQGIDAVIFLANATRPMTQGERELLHDLKTQLQVGQLDRPVDNLFVLVNFMDLLRRDKDRQQVRQLVENFVQGKSPIIAGKNRIHFISAQAALDAILEGTNDPYLESFQRFTQALEHFLTQERGSLEINGAVTKLSYLIQESQASLRQNEALLEGKVNLSEIEKQKILDQIGDISGRQVKIQLFADSLIEPVIDQMADAWDQWVEGIEEHIATKSGQWVSEHQEKDKILRDYTHQCTRDLSAELDAWMAKDVKISILQPCMTRLTSFISEEITQVQANLRILDSTLGSHLSSQYELSLSELGIDLDFYALDSLSEEGGNFWGGFLSGGGIAAGLLTGIVGLSFLPAVLAGGAIGAVVGLLFSEDPAATRLKMKEEVYYQGFEKFAESSEAIFNGICNKFDMAIKAQVERANCAIESSIFILNNLLEQQEKLYQDNLQNCGSAKILIQQKLQEFSQVQSQIQRLLEKSL